MELEALFRKAKAAKEVMSGLEGRIDGVLLSLAGRLEARVDFVLGENRKDLARMDPADPRYDRLELTPGRVRDMAGDLRRVAALRSPLGRVVEERTLPNGLLLTRVTVPLGVVGMVYEARPNVTTDAFSLAFKTGNVTVLKGGSDAEASNRALVACIHEVLGKDGDVLTLLPSERSSTEALLKARGCVDLVIPRGSQQLIDYVRENARVPVIETGAGVVHTYADRSADVTRGAAVICNAKTRRVSVCNALDCLIVHEALLPLLDGLVAPLAESQVTLYADGPAYESLKGRYPDELLERATEAHFGTEFLSLRMAVRTVGSLDEALDHIRTYGSGHSEAILSEDPSAADRFVRSVDAAAVYVNASTAFTDGAQFGLGAEIGISTQKLHARGPMGLDALTSYKWIVRGSGQTR